MRQIFSLAFCAFVLFFSSLDTVYCQCNGSPCGTPLPQANPLGVCYVSEPNELTCYIGSTTNEPATVFPAWCGSNINTQWFGFVAIAPTATFVVANNSCTQGTTLQIGVFSTSDCVNFTIISNCDNNIPVNQSGGVTATGMIPGQVYYLCVGGSNGALCDFQINPPGWGGFAVNCVLQSLQGLPYSTYATDAIWSVEPPGAAIFTPPTGPVTQITWLEPGSINLCVNSSNCPEYCQTVDVAGGQYEEHVDLCQGQSVNCAGHTYNAPGVYTIVEPDGPWCEKTTYCHVHLVPTTYTTDTVYMCQNGSVTCAGEEFSSPGSFPVTLMGFKGCDSIVTCKVNIYPIIPPTNLTINICGPGEYQVCDNIFSASGTYTEVCTSSLGCDSVVNLNLAILNPVAMIDPPDTITCNSIILDGSLSSVNTAVGGITTYQWSGPGIIGANNASTVQVNQAGNYCLIVTHSRGGVLCRDTACVDVVAISLPPQPPQISGNINPCKDSTYIYTATLNGSTTAASFTWTLPGNTTFTQLTSNSIQVTWDTVLVGNICASVANQCGVSQPGCLPIEVQLPVQTPVINGPAQVCAGGGNYTFTLGMAAADAIYSWVIPPGAILTGSGDTVQINFQNAATGQVCVTPQNACGLGTTVCQNVQINPVPTADISDNAVICLGDSANLLFAIGGASSMDITWSINNQVFTLDNISNGHIETVSPVQTTIYKLTGISDNSPLACATALTDSVIVTVIQPSIIATTAQICAGQSIWVGGGPQNMPGVYTDTLSNINGCDSIVTTTLLVLISDTTLINAVTCNPAAAGTTTQILTQTNGCDSVIITTIALLPSDTTFRIESSCNTNNLGVFTQNLTNVFGCDSTIITTVVFSLADTTLIYATTCDTGEVGVFNNNLVTSDGCDSLVITTISLLPSDTTNLVATTCNLSSVGIFTTTLNNQLGCDSTVITTISFEPIPITAIAATTCDPAAAGIFTNLFTTAAGCDSTVVTTVDLLPASSTMLASTTCNPANVGIFTTVLTNYWGCDSTITTTVTLDPLPVTLLTTTTCDPASVGVFTDHFTTAAGCDSTVVTTVNLLAASSTMLNGTTCNPANVGVFTTISTNYLGCDSIITTTISLELLPITSLMSTTCDPAAAGVFTSHYITAEGCDSTVISSVSLLPESITMLTGVSCNPIDTGIFIHVLTNHLGCDSTVVTTVSLMPSSQTSLNATTCDPAMAGVFVYNLVNYLGCDSIVTETRTLIPSSTTAIQRTTCDTGQVGSVTSILTNQYGCDSTIITTTTLLPANSCAVAVDLAGSTSSCLSNTGTLLLTPTVGLAPFSYSVLLGSMVVATGMIPDLGVSQTISNLIPGDYTISITSPNGFSTTAQAQILQPVLPNLTSIANSDYSGFDISCTNASDGSAIAIPAGGTPPYTYSWSNGGVSQQITNLSSGIYTVTITDTNFCSNTSTVALLAPLPLTMSFIVNDLDCFGQNDGAIQVMVTGGVAPYQYALNNGPDQQSNTFTGLDAGLYRLSVTDANGCEQTDIIVINAASLLNVDLGDDINIGLGENATLQATVNVPIDSILSAVWTPPLDSAGCDSPVCLTQVVTPLVSTVYTVQVQALNGCTDEDNLTVFVDRRPQVYVPNVFTPNQETANNLFTIYAKPGSISKIKSMRIYDRWGEVVFILTDFQPNNPEIGWDGTHNGRQMNPGVFIWVAEIVFIDGQLEVFKGDVTIVR